MTNQCHQGKPEEKDDEQDDLDDGDWMSISSDEGKAKVIHVHEKASASKKSKKDKKENTMSPEEIKAMRQENGKTARRAKKIQGWLEPLIKTCNKAAKASHTEDGFKEQIAAAKDIVKDCKKLVDKQKQKNKALETLNLEYTEELVKELQKSLEKHLKCHQTVGALKNGGMDADEIEALVASATARKAKDALVQNVD